MHKADTVSALCEVAEPGVITQSMLVSLAIDQGPKKEGGRLFVQDGIELDKLEEIRIEFLEILNIDHLWLLKSLVKLSLSHNVIEKVENLDELCHLRELDLSFNHIKIMENLNNLRQLEILLLYSNEISIVQGISDLKKLIILNIGKNKIDDWKHGRATHFVSGRRLVGKGISGGMARQPPKYELLPEEKTKEMLKLFKGERTGFVLVGPKKYFFPFRYVEQCDGFYNFEIRSSDIFILSYPRSGTTMTQELIWLLANNLNFDLAKKHLLSKRFPYLEYSMFHHPEVTDEFVLMNKDDITKQQYCREIAKPGYEVLADMPSPRFIKSHFPFSMLPPGFLNIGCKIVYVARNPKDVAVSWYYLNCAIKTQGYVGDFATFWDYFQNDLTPYSPYWAHLKEAWALRHNKNMLFMFYEEIIYDLPKAIKKIATFLGKTYTDEEINKVADYLNIQNFRNNPMVNNSDLKACGIINNDNFVRKGGCGNWKDIFTSELNSKAEKWIDENLRDTDLRFPLFNINNNKNN